MSMQPAVRSSREPLGGRSGDQGRRLLRHHLPLGLASVLVIVVFKTLPLFDPTKYQGSVDLSSGPFPQRRGESGSTGHGGDRGEPTGHGGDQAGSTGHGGDRGEPTGHGGDQAGSTGHGGEMVPDETMGARGGRSFTQRFTDATGYVATGLLAVTLLIGPANLLLRRRNPVSSYLRRDVGAWAAAFSVVHVFFGLQVHGRLRDFLDYFVAPDGGPLANSFGLANWTGLAGTVIVVGLLAISSNFALRKLKARRWKRLQRLNYGLFALVLAHAVFYGALLRVASPFTILLLVSVIAVFVGQALGVWLWRRRHSRAAPDLA